MSSNQITKLAQWLAPLDAKRLECDGMTRVISALMLRDDVAHRVHVGSLSVSDVGLIPLHWWIQLESGEICDFRARMWLGQGEQVPHGIFPAEPHHRYATAQMLEPENFAADAFLFWILTEGSLADYPRWEPPATKITRSSSPSF